MNATLVTFPGISSFECLTASSLNKFSRSVEQAPAMLQITLHITYLWRICHRIYHRIYNQPALTCARMRSCVHMLTYAFSLYEVPFTCGYIVIYF